MPISRTERNLWSAFIDEAKITQMYYAFAEKAEEEGLPEVAKVFVEVAEAEKLHALSHLKVTGDVRSTVENLKTITQGEIEEIELVYPRMIREAEEEGRADAISSFTYAWGEEREHLASLQEALDKLLKEHPDLLKASQQDGGRAEANHDLPSPVTGEERQRARREVFNEKERINTLQRLREVMFGAQDGLVSTVAVASSVALATGDSGIVIIAGATSALAGMVSMAAGSYLGSRAEEEVHISELEFEAREIEDHPAEELAELIEIYQREGMSFNEAVDLAERVSADKGLWLRTLAEKELGLSAEPLGSPLKDSMTMGVSFIAGAVFPMLLYFFIDARAAVLPSILLTLTTLFVVGTMKGKILNRSPLRSGLEVVGVGTMSAVIGYVIGTLLPGLVGVNVIG